VNRVKAFVSVDLEGMPFIVTPAHLNIKGSLYHEARQIATKVASIVVDELNKNGFDKIILADSHGPMVNLLVDDLPTYTEVIRGYPRPVAMVSGVEECDVALFLGYHAKFGTSRSTFDHTYSGGSIFRVKVNGIEASEFLMNSYVAGSFDVPVILVAGEARLLDDDVRVLAPWAEAVSLKRSLSRLSSRSSSMEKIERELRDAVVRAVISSRKGAVQPLKTKKPVEMEITFLASHFADIAELLPGVNRMDGLTVEYSASDMIEAYKTFELLVIAAAGLSAILERSS